MGTLETSKASGYLHFLHITKFLITIVACGPKSQSHINWEDFTVFLKRQKLLVNEP